MLYYQSNKKLQQLEE